MFNVDNNIRGVVEREQHFMPINGENKIVWNDREKSASSIAKLVHGND